jgi:hypothetical protein
MCVKSSRWFIQGSERERSRFTIETYRIAAWIEDGKGTSHDEAASLSNRFGLCVVSPPGRVEEFLDTSVSVG